KKRSPSAGRLPSATAENDAGRTPGAAADDSVERADPPAAPRERPVPCRTAPPTASARADRSARRREPPGRGPEARFAGAAAASLARHFREIAGATRSRRHPTVPKNRTSRTALRRRASRPHGCRAVAGRFVPCERVVSGAACRTDTRLHALTLG